MPTPPVVLSIAGYDPSSGAGITADIKTAAALGCYALTCPTALTAQSTQGVFAVEAVEPELVSQILTALAEDFEIAAVKIGMMGTGEVAAAVKAFLGLRRLPNVVLDPVILSSSGHALLDNAGIEIMRAMLPLCDVITPNIAEAAILTGFETVPENQSWDAALPAIHQMTARLHELGVKAAVITGGHLNPPNDFLSYRRGGKIESDVFPGEHIESRSTHGTGCAFATALACRLALGDELKQAVRAAKDYVRRGIISAYRLGKGIGPLNHLG